MTKLSAILAFAVLISISVAEVDFETEWKNFKISYGRHYESTHEENFRKEIFRKTWETVNEHNKKYAKGEVTWSMGINAFSDRTTKEMKKMMGVIHLLSADIDTEWEHYKKTFGKRYNTPEKDAFRKELFRKNWEIVKQHNKDYKNGKTTWTMEINKFSDWTLEEKKKMMGGLRG